MLRSSSENFPPNFVHQLRSSSILPLPVPIKDSETSENFLATNLNIHRNEHLSPKSRASAYFGYKNSFNSSLHSLTFPYSSTGSGSPTDPPTRGLSPILPGHNQPVESTFSAEEAQHLTLPLEEISLSADLVSNCKAQSNSTRRAKKKAGKKKSTRKGAKQNTKELPDDSNKEEKASNFSSLCSSPVLLEFNAIELQNESTSEETTDQTADTDHSNLDSKFLTEDHVTETGNDLDSPLRRKTVTFSESAEVCTFQRQVSDSNSKIGTDLLAHICENDIASSRPLPLIPASLDAIDANVNETHVPTAPMHKNEERILTRPASFVLPLLHEKETESLERFGLDQYMISNEIYSKATAAPCSLQKSSFMLGEKNSIENSSPESASEASQSGQLSDDSHNRSSAESCSSPENIVSNSTVPRLSFDAPREDSMAEISEALNRVIQKQKVIFFSLRF